MRSCLIAVTLLALALGGCSKVIPSDADHQNELKLNPVVGRGGGSDDSIKPKPAVTPAVGRAGGSDDSIKPKPATPAVLPAPTGDTLRPATPAQPPAARPTPAR